MWFGFIGVLIFSLTLPATRFAVDGLDPAWVTVMRYSDYAWRDVPESWLQRDYLPRFKPE